MMVNEMKDGIKLFEDKKVRTHWDEKDEKIMVNGKLLMDAGWCLQGKLDGPFESYIGTICPQGKINTLECALIISH